jgi:hypothetical protein
MRRTAFERTDETSDPAHTLVLLKSPVNIDGCRHLVMGKRVEVAVVTGDTLIELVFGQEVEKLGEDGATFVHQVKNRRNAGSHPQGIVAEIKSKNDRAAVLSSFYNGENAVIKS